MSELPLPAPLADGYLGELPPPDIISIVEKTSQFVAKNGPEFEKRIMASNAGNMKFNFLNPSDPYHAYYRQRLAEAWSQNQGSKKQEYN